MGNWINQGCIHKNKKNSGDNIADILHTHGQQASRESLHSLWSAQRLPYRELIESIIPATMPPRGCLSAPHELSKNACYPVQSPIISPNPACSGYQRHLSRALVIVYGPRDKCSTCDRCRHALVLKVFTHLIAPSYSTTALLHLLLPDPFPIPFV